MSSRTNLQVLVLSPQDLVGVLVLGPKSLSLSWTTKSSEIVKDYTFCKQTVMHDHMKSINLVTTTMHEVTMKNHGLLTDIRYYLLLYTIHHSSL